jgi:hypothetical protein
MVVPIAAGGEVEEEKGEGEGDDDSYSSHVCALKI